jgi:hypothetical protein
MARFFVAAALGAMTIFTVAGSTTFASADHASQTITIQVRNEPNVDPRALFSVRGDVTRLYRRAGIELTWAPTGAQLVIVLGGEWEASRVAAGPDVMGVAMISRTSKRGRVAHIYYDRVRDQAALAGLEPDSILGSVIAHEIGHLLGVSHATNGLMRAGWNELELGLAANGLLDFSPEQREIIHQGVAALAADQASAGSAAFRGRAPAHSSFPQSSAALWPNARGPIPIHGSTDAP